MTSATMLFKADSVPRIRRSGDRPEITIVVASNRDRALLNGCLASLLPQCERAAVEIIVARAGSAAELVELRAAVPGVRWLGASQSSTIAQLRGLGMSESTGDIVALTEDRCVAADGWIDALLTGQGDHARVRSGDASDVRHARAFDWRMYFAENAFFSEAGPERSRDPHELAAYDIRSPHRNGSSHAAAQ